jgi:hypothetical protein
MSNKNKKNEIPRWAQQGHKKPVSRREFLAAGIIPFSAYMMAPNWMKMLLGPDLALAAPNCPTAGSGMIPIICVDLAGGAGLQSNFVPHTQDLQLLTSYTKMGLGTTSTLPIERAFGNVPFAGVRPSLAANPADNRYYIATFLKGFRNTAAAAEANTAFVGVCMNSQDDTNANPISPMGMIARAGLTGSQLPGLGTDDSASGGRHRPALITPPAPLIVRNFNDIANSLGYAESLGTMLSKNQKVALAKTVDRLNASQSAKLMSMTNGQQIKTLIDCAGIKNTEIVTTGGGAVDPALDAAVAPIWNMGDARQKAFASIAYNTIMGNSGGSTISLGGYDYHDNTRTTSDNDDRVAGELVGRIIATAAALQKKVFLFVTTDGSVGSDSASFEGVWTGDRGNASAGYLLYYDPAKRPETSSFQIGAYTNEQVTDSKSITSSTEGAAAAVFANWLKINNRMDLYAAIADRVLPQAELDKVLRFS